MIEYYTAIVIFSCMALGVLSILVHENGRFEREIKYRFYSAYGMLMLAMIAEWAGLFLDGAPAWTSQIHALTKCLDYVCTPIVGVLIVRQILESDRWRRAMWMVLLANVVLEIVSIFTGWTFYVDAENYYHHGPFYFVYAIVFSLSVAYVLFGFLQYGRQFKRHNRGSLYAIIMLTILGIVVQETAGKGIKVSNLVLVFCSAFLFIHYSEFLQMKKDEDMSQQKILIETDALTGMLSRHAYSEMLDEYDRMEQLPSDLVVFAIDINGLKSTNDMLGHEAGDELICGAAECISGVLGSYGRCFRTGGDEFVAVLEMGEKQISTVEEALAKRASGWRGKIVQRMSLSVGYAVAREHPELSIEKMINIADQKMYADKAAYYQNNGMDRRRRGPLS